MMDLLTEMNKINVARVADIMREKGMRWCRPTTSFTT